MSTLRSEIVRRLELGLSQAEVARQLGIAHATVGYHLRRLAEPPPPPPEMDSRPPAGASKTHETRGRVAELLRRGHTRQEIADILGLKKQTISYHARRLGAEIDERFARRYDWALIQRYYDQGHSVRECCAAFGCSQGSWHNAMRRGSLVTRPTQAPIDELLVVGRALNRGHLKKRLLQAGLKDPLCEDCGLTSWCGRPISLTLHHINGVRDDNRLENLRLLCPNCHSQTPNFAGRRTRLALVSPPADAADLPETG